MTTALWHHFVTANGIRLRLADQGRGPLVLLCHGFPETSSAWRHQLPALAAAGFRAVAPDLRGFGKSDSPADVAAYSVIDVLGDLVALVEVLGERDAVIVGSDWGATLAWQAALLRPDRFRAVVALGVPMMRRAPMAPSRLFPQNKEAQFYTHYLSEPNTPERELERDVATTLRKVYFAASADVGPRDAVGTPNPFGMVARGGGLLDALPEPTTPSAWLAPADLAVLVEDFTASGFRGALNYYRNLDRNWAQQAAFDDRSIEVPALYLVGERDTGFSIPGMREIIAAMPQLVPRLHDSVLVPNAGHWLQQEAPEAVNAALLAFLRALTEPGV